MTAQPPIVLHVGLHKCGSTWLQNNIFERTEYGLCAPWGGMSHAAVTEFVAIDPLEFDPQAARAKFDIALSKSASKDATYIVSHEALSSRPHLGSYYAPDVAGRLKATFPDAKIMLVFREQSKILYSLYGEYVRNGGRNTLQEFFGTGQEPDGWSPVCKLSFFEYHRLVETYQTLFGQDNVLALPLEWMSTQPNLFLERLFAFAGHPTPPDLKISHRSNPGWGPITVELYRRSNGVFRANPLGPKQSHLYNARQYIAWRLDRLIPKILNTRIEARRKAFLNTRIAQYYCTSNTRLSKLTGIDLKALGYM